MAVEGFLSCYLSNHINILYYIYEAYQIGSIHMTYHTKGFTTDLYPTPRKPWSYIKQEQKKKCQNRNNI